MASKIFVIEINGREIYRVYSASEAEWFSAMSGASVRVIDLLSHPTGADQ